MSGIEDLLRDAYQDAAQTVGPERIWSAVQLPRRQPGRGFRAFVPLAAAAAVVVVIAGSLVGPRLLSSAHPRPDISYASATAGTPPFVVALPYFGVAAEKLAVQVAGTRKVQGLVPPPRGMSWESVAATGSGTTFVAAARTAGSNCGTVLYTLTLSAAGKPAGLRPLGGPAMAGQLTTNTSLAVSSDARTIAYATVPCQISYTGPATIGVIARGVNRQWTVPASLYPTSLSLSADGRELGYATKPLAGSAPDAGGALILPTDSPPGAAARYSRAVVSDAGTTSAESAVLSPDGGTMYVVTATSGKSYLSVRLAAYRSADRVRLRTLHTWQNVPLYYFPSVAIGGDQLLIWAISRSFTYQVDLASGDVTPFWMYTPDGESPYGASPETVAWLFSMGTFRASFRYDDKSTRRNTGGGRACRQRGR